MTLLEALIAYGVSNEVLLGAGVDSFIDFLPETPDSVVSFIEYGGDPPSPFTTTVHRSVQVTVRAKQSTTARSKAVELCNLFASVGEDRRIDFVSNLWGQVYVRQLPYKREQDKSDRFIYGFNLGVTTNILD